MGHSRNRGFSLIELIIAIAILVVLTGLLAPQFTKYIEKARWAKAVQTLDNIYSALEVAYIEVSQADKEAAEGTGGWLRVLGGKTVEGSNAGKAICENMRETLGDDLMDRVDIDISVEEDSENKDDLSIILIKYLSNKKSDHTNFYYFGRGVEGDGFPGKYGQCRDNKVVKWQ